MTAAQELERLVVRIVGDGSHYTKTLDKAVKDTTSAVNQINRATGKAVSITPKTTRVPGAAKVNRAMMGGTSFAALNADLPKATAATKTHTKAVREAAVALPAATVAQTTHTSAVKAAVAPLNSARDATGRFTKTLNGATNAHKAGGVAARNHGGALGMFSNMVKSAGQSIQSSTSRLAAAGKVMGLMGTIMAVSVTLPIVGAATALVKLAADAETTKNQFAVMLGADQGQKMLDNLRKMGAETPFEFPELAASARTLIGFGVAEKDVLRTMKMVGDVAAGTGTDVKALSVVFGQIKGMGRLQGQDMMQLVNAGISYNDIGETIGKTTAEVKEAMEDGLIPFEVVEETFRRLSSEGGRFNNMMEVLSATASGKFSNLVDVVTQTAVAMGEYLLPTIKDVLDYLIAGAAWFKGLGESVHKTFMFVVALVGGVAPLIIALGAFASLIGLLGGTLGAMFMAGMGIVVLMAKWALGIYLVVKGFQMLVDAIYGEGSFVGALVAAGKAGWAFAQNVLGFIMNIKQNFENIVGWVSVQFANMFAGVAEVWGDDINGGIAMVKGWGHAVKTATTVAWMYIGYFAGKAIGFFANIGENSRIIFDWLKDNWFNILKDMGVALWTYLENTVSNWFTTFETILRLLTLWQGFMAGVFRDVFTVDFLKFVWQGVKDAASAILDFCKSAWEAIKNIFKGGDMSGLEATVSNMGVNLGKDFQTGLNGGLDGLVSGAKTILTEQAGKMKTPLDGFQASTPGLQLNLDRGNMPKIVTDIMAPAKAAEDKAKKTAPEIKTMALKDKKKKEKKEADKQEEVKTGEFKQMSLKQFGIKTIGLNNAPVKKKQEVTDTGVQGKLDEVVGAIKGGQNQPAVMGR